MREIPAEVVLLRPRPSRPVLLGMLAGLTALLQLGPIYWPGGGYLLAMGATLPTALAAGLSPRRCTRFFLAAGFVIGLLSVQEFFIYLTMTGPLGLILGLTAHRPPWLSITVAGALLTGGMLLLPLLAGVLPWGGVEAAWPLVERSAAYAAFALAYSALWLAAYRKVAARLAPWLAMRYTEGNGP
jgi:hypothetical protein